MYGSQTEKKHNTNPFPPQYRWFLTGTPMENSPVDIFNLFRLVHPSIFGLNPTKFNELYFEDKWHKKPKNLDDLARRIAPYMLRRTKITESIPKVRIDFIRLDMTDAQEAINQELICTSLLVRDKSLSDEDQQKLKDQGISLLTNYGLMVQVADSPALLERSDSKYGKTLYKQHASTESPKLDWTVDFLVERKVDPENKTIIFTRSDDIAMALHERLLKSGFTEADLILYVGGLSETQQKKAKEKFINGTGSVFIGTDAAAEGLNLQKADVIVCIDLPYHPSRLDQRIGRAQRRGSAFEFIHVFCLISVNSIDERHLQVIYEKQDMINKVIEGNAYDVPLTDEVVLELLSNKKKEV
jgi:SNF2 family DNA or RNA helicase